MIDEIQSLTGNEYEKDTVLGAFSRTNVTTKLNEEALNAFAQTSYEQGFITALPKEGFVDTSILEGLSGGDKE